jgi:hypothetical protein
MVWASIDHGEKPQTYRCDRFTKLKGVKGERASSALA